MKQIIHGRKRAQRPQSFARRNPLRFLRSFAAKPPRIALAFLVTSVLLGSGQGFADEDSTDLLQSLEKRFSTIKTVQTKFRQEKELKVFSRTIVMEGRVVLENPDRLAWRIDTPIRYVLVLNGKYAMQWDEDSNKVQKMKTHGDPIFEEVIGQIEKWFSGEFASLLNDYDLTIKSEQPPVLEFIPKQGGMIGKVIRRVTISVREDRRYVERIAIEDVGGDKTTITFYDTVLNAPVAAGEWEVVPDA